MPRESVYELMLFISRQVLKDLRDLHGLTGMPGDRYFQDGVQHLAQLQEAVRKRVDVETFDAHLRLVTGLFPEAEIPTQRV